MIVTSQSGGSRAGENRLRSHRYLRDDEPGSPRIRFGASVQGAGKDSRHGRLLPLAEP